MFVDAAGAIAVVDFGIMGRLDQATRFYLADMLIGFLSGDYRRVAEVHFAEGYLPPSRSLDAFAQACRSIGEPILGRPLQDISIARLLAQLFEITEQFAMETQPQLLLLQKTMVVIEGVGRRLDPQINIWTLARPLIEDWMRRIAVPKPKPASGWRPSPISRSGCRASCAASRHSSPTGREEALFLCRNPGGPSSSSRPAPGDCARPGMGHGGGARSDSADAHFRAIAPGQKSPRL